jgi:hypothetical protein
MRVFKAAGIKTATEGADGYKKRALVSFHSLRHTFVSLAANAGVPMALVQSIVGHSTVDMTRHYFHESESALVSAVAALPNVTGGESDAVGVSPRVRQICALADELTDAERGDVLRYLQAGRRKSDAVAVECVAEIEHGDEPAQGVPMIEQAAEARTVAA